MTSDETAREAPAPVPIARRLLTVKEAADALGLSRSKVYQLVASDDIETVHIGRSIRVPIAAVDDFVDRLRSAHLS